MKIKATVSKTGDDGVRWLVIESDEDDTNGYFIYYHVSNTTAYDTWHKTIEEAFEAAETQYGIVRTEWEQISDD